MKKKNLLSGILVSAMMVTLLAGCSSESGGGEGGEDQLTVAGIVFQNDEFAKMMQQGMSDAAEDAGARFLPGNSEDSVDRESELVNTYVSSDVDGIAVNILDADTSVAALENAYNEGIEVVVVNTEMNADFQASTVQSNQEALGRMTGEKCREFIEEELGGGAQLGIIEFATLIPATSNASCDGFQSQIDDREGVA